MASQEEAYTLGVLIGDGFVGRSRKTSYQIALKTKDEAFAEAFKDALEKQGIHARKAFYDVWRVWAYNKKAALRFLSLLSKVEEWLSSADKTLVASFVRGFFDSEGSSRKRKVNTITISFSNTNLPLLQTLKTVLARYFGIYSGIYQEHKAGTESQIKGKKLHRTKNAYSLQFSCEESIRTFAVEIGTSIPRKEEAMNYVKSKSSPDGRR